MSKGKESTAKQFAARGIRNWSAFPKQFIDICKMDQMTLKHYLVQELENHYVDVIVGDGFIYAPGGDVVVTAHMDTVHKETVKTIYGYKDKKTKKHSISSPQGIGGDDRCGIYMILKIIENGYHPTVLFCEDEEIGGVGSEKFCKTEYIKELYDKKFMIELDRANADDLVFYNDDNEEFHYWCAQVTGYTEAYGSFSDISNLCPETGVSGVNISCGYYNPHTTSEFVVLEEMNASIEAAMMLIANADSVEQFEYTTRSGYTTDLSKYYLYYGNEYYGGSVRMEICYFDADKKEIEAVVDGETEAECWMHFFADNPSVCFNDVFDWFNL